MQSKSAPGPSHRRGQVRQLGDRTLETGLAGYFFVFCALVGLSGFGLYQALQPTRYPNPGLSAQELSPSGGIIELRELQLRSDDKSGITPEFAFVTEPTEKAIGEAAPQPTRHKKIDHATTAASKRTHAVQRRQRNPGTAYAAQPFASGYQSWGSYQSGTSDRPWDGSQGWGGYRAWGSYQISRPHRPGN